MTLVLGLFQHPASLLAALSTAPRLAGGGHTPSLPGTDFLLAIQHLDYDLCGVLPRGASGESKQVAHDQAIMQGQHQFYERREFCVSGYSTALLGSA